MLDYNNYCIGKLENLKDIFITSYVIIDDIYKELIPIEVKERRNISKSKLSYSEIITISLVGELLTIDSEISWFNFVKNNFRDLFPQIGDRTSFNRTKRNLYTVIREIQSKFFFLNNFSDHPVRIVDSMPIPVCEFARAYFSKCFKDISSYGYYASKKETYFGLKLHTLITNNRYISDSLSKELANEREISLLAIQRKNSKKVIPKNFRNTLSKMRRRIKTSFSQLAGQLNINKILVKSKLGLLTRITLKVLAHNLAYLLNNLMGKTKNIGQIKHLIFV